MITGVVFVVLSAWFMISLGVSLGISDQGKVDRFGVARIQECHRSPLRFWMIHVCQAEVRWDRKALGRPLVTSAVIGSVSDLSGEVNVVSYRSAGRYGALQYSIVPVDRPRAPFSYGWWMFFTFVSLIPGYVVGWFAGKGIDRLMPEPTEKPKDWRGVSRRATPGMNGRRRKRGRR
ncbi:hypothetical protein [Amycolatopsis decaplanina]|uniref:Uncharacterized protein n=1 Tax=Amycolatopsis decaplanina DSM 44594 TaxID=1284240 RepID=M2XPL3_9PSEU|nr:hypothetical protein [Amycolatopsis decaplanina]EME62966.1 hypothetical protein H074_07044 [Amycolatopsis decaplanina DSM 44594]